MKISNSQISEQGSLPNELMEEILKTKDKFLDLSDCENLTVLPKLPTQIKELRLSNCFRLERLENLAEMTEITFLDLTNCTSLISPELPKGLAHLNLAGCENLKVLPELPKELTYLDLSDWEILELPEIPKGLTHLILAGCEKLKGLIELPEGLDHLDLSGCEKLEVLSELPKGLNHLDLSGCEKLEVLPELPKELTHLDLFGWKELTILPPLPQTLTYLNLSSCENLEVLPELPNGLKRLDLSGCEKLEVLPELPKGLTRLNLSGCEKLKVLPDLPDTLTSLDLSGCYGLEVLPDLPDTLTSLDLSGCYSLEALPNLPKTLTSLCLSGCCNLEVLPDDLSKALTFLDLSDCRNLKALPDLPETLSFLDLSGCCKLEYKEETISRIKELEIKGCKITYPEHFDPDFIKTKKTLEEAIESYQERPKPIYITELLMRYLTEDATQRGGLADLVKSSKPFLNLISKEPGNLKWLDQIASLYLDACINQPVIGWSEISACVSIAEAPTVIEKIEASKHLATTILMKSFICDLEKDQKPTPLLEAEFANALFREVHNKLLKEKKIDTTKPWYAVPKNIANEYCIERFLTTKLIDKACKKINEHIFSNEKMANILTNNYSEIWGQIAFPQELKQIKDKYDERMEKGEEVTKERQEEIDKTISELTFQALTSEVAPRSTSGKRPGEEGGYSLGGFSKKVRG